MGVIPERLMPGTLEWEVYRHEHEQRYRFFSDDYRGLDILDAACGVGYGSAIIAECGARSVTGIDVDASALEYAGKNYARPGVSFAQASAERLTELGRTFDLVVSFETIEHLPDPPGFLREVRQVLRPGGRFICSTPNRDFGGKGKDHENPYHLSEMSLQEFADAFGKYFIIEDRFHQSHTESFRRHIQLVGELERVAKVTRFSKLLALENRLRRWMGKEVWEVGMPAANLGRALSGDYAIERFELPAELHLTYILRGTVGT
jgi:SAM-dependent methyltransferase